MKEELWKVKGYQLSDGFGSEAAPMNSSEWDGSACVGPMPQALTGGRP